MRSRVDMNMQGQLVQWLDMDFRHLSERERVVAYRKHNGVNMTAFANGCKMRDFGEITLIIETGSDYL